MAAIRKSLTRAASTIATPIKTSPFAPRHFLSIADLSTSELTTLVRNAAEYKVAIKSGVMPEHLKGSLSGKIFALMFSKRSTRTRVSSESAITHLGGNSMFLGKEDIQLGVNESLYDTTLIVSSMTHGIIARVGPHSDVADIAKHSTVPVINALSDRFHPLQTIADYLTIHETFPSTSSESGLGLRGRKIAWIGDANNVLYDLAIASAKLGVQMAVATPKGYEIPSDLQELINSTAKENNSPNLITTTVPEEAVKDADILVTDTWVSMGQEAETVKRLKAFAGYQITEDLAKRGGAKEGWKFMHCLPRHPEEVDDQIFYGPRSLVFQEGENRLWGMISTLEAFVLNKGRIS